MVSFIQNPNVPIIDKFELIITDQIEPCFLSVILYQKGVK